MQDIKEAVKTAVKALDEHIGHNIEVLDIGNLTTIADYFIVVDAASESQLNALCDAVDEALVKIGVFPLRIEGANTVDWILMDYGEFVVHLFSRKAREFYDLDRIWNDAKTITADEILQEA